MTTAAHPGWAGPDDARRKLREAALRQVRESGARNLSMRGLAATLGISAMTAYRYYPDKLALFKDLKTEISADFAQALQAAFAEADADPARRLIAMAVAYLEFAIANEHAYRLMFDEWLGEREPDREGPPPDAPSWKLLLTLLAQLLPNADAPQLADKAHLLWATVHGMAMLHLAGRVPLGSPIGGAVQPQLQALLMALRN